MNKPTDKAESTQAASGRRSAEDRRKSGDRRRNADARTAIIHVTPTALRVLVLVDRGGEKSVAAVCRSLPWRIDAESLHSEQGTAELTAAMAKLASEERLAGSRAEVLLSSELCVTRAVTGVAEEVQRETATLRERSQLYLSLGPGKKVIASSSTPLDARHAHALLTVATEHTLQVLYRAVESAGMELAGIRSAQVALARAVQYVTGDQAGASLVVGVDDGNVELGVIARGRLFLDYRPGGGTRVDQLADLLGQHHTRLERYCQRHHGLEKHKLKKVFVSGPKEEALRAADVIAAIKHFDVEVLDPQSVHLPWDQRGGVLGPEMAAVLGAAMAVVQPTTDRGPNLIDQLLSNTRPPVGKLLARKLIPIAAAAMVAVVFGILNWRTGCEVAAMQAELQLLAPQAARAAVLRSELLAGHTETTQLKALESQMVTAPHSLLLRNLTQSVPAHVWLVGLRIEGSDVATLTGASYVESSIYDLVGQLQHLPGVAQVALQGTGVGRAARHNATTFDIHLDLDLVGKGDSPQEQM